MEALSIKEPWASLIREGKKTIETRTWGTKYRGRLLLCCSKKPGSSFAGYAFAVANIVHCREMLKMDEEDAMCELYPGAYSWILKNIRPIIPFKVKGKLRLFDVDFNPDYLKEVLYDL